MNILALPTHSTEKNVTHAYGITNKAHLQLLEQMYSEFASSATVIVTNGFSFM